MINKKSNGANRNWFRVGVGASGRTSLRLRTGEGYARPAPCRRLSAGHRVTRYAAPILKVWGTGDRGLRPPEGRHALRDASSPRRTVASRPRLQGVRSRKAMVSVSLSRVVVWRIAAIPGTAWPHRRLRRLGGWCAQAAFFCSTWPVPPPALIAIRRGFIASGISRISSIFRSPSAQEAPLTCMWSARLNTRRNGRAEIP